MPTNNNFNAHDMERSMQDWIAEFERRMHEDLPASEREKPIAETLRERKNPDLHDDETPNVVINHDKKEINVYTHFILYGQCINDNKGTDLNKHIIEKWGDELKMRFGADNLTNFDFKEIICTDIMSKWNNVDGQGYGKRVINNEEYNVKFNITSEYKINIDNIIVIDMDKDYRNQYWAVYFDHLIQTSNIDVFGGRTGSFLVEQVLGVGRYYYSSRTAAHEYGHILGLEHHVSINGVQKMINPYYEERFNITDADGKEIHILRYEKGSSTMDMRGIIPNIMTYGFWVDREFRVNPSAKEPFEDFDSGGRKCVFFPYGSISDHGKFIVTSQNITGFFLFWQARENHNDKNNLLKNSFVKKWCIINKNIYHETPSDY